MIELTSRLQELYVGLPRSSADIPSSLTLSFPTSIVSASTILMEYGEALTTLT